MYVRLWMALAVAVLAAWLIIVLAPVLAAVARGAYLTARTQLAAAKRILTGAQDHD
jgi:hypothetical protein